MTIHVLAMLAGVFAVPALLLGTAHRFRRRSPYVQTIFRGALIGHLVALVVGTWAALTPAEAWTGSDIVRGAFGLWSYLLLPFVGAVIATARDRRRAKGRVGAKVG